MEINELLRKTDQWSGRWRNITNGNRQTNWEEITGDTLTVDGRRIIIPQEVHILSSPVLDHKQFWQVCIDLYNLDGT